MRWRCKNDGCFNLKRRPKIEEFSDCFPGRINLGDVDGIVEINGWFLMIEWKGAGGSVGKGQEIMYKQLTRLAKPGCPRHAQRNIVIIVHGDAETMEVSGYQVYRTGAARPPKKGSLDSVKEVCVEWVGWVSEQ